MFFHVSDVLIIFVYIGIALESNIKQSYYRLVFVNFKIIISHFMLFIGIQTNSYMDKWLHERMTEWTNGCMNE